MANTDYLKQKTSTKDMRVLIRNMFNPDMVMEYGFSEDEMTLGDVIRAERELGEIMTDDENIEDDNHGVEDSVMVNFEEDEENGTGTYTTMNLISTKTTENNKRWIIEWYEGVWDEESVEEVDEQTKFAKMKLRKKGNIKREVFYSVEGYSERLTDLRTSWEEQAIIVGTYECDIVNKNPEEVLM